jgi:hypothetical protein
VGREAATDTRVLVAALEAITDVVEFGGGPAAAGRLLGIKSGAVPDHLAKLWSGVERDAAAIDKAAQSGHDGADGSPIRPGRFG